MLSAIAIASSALQLRPQLTPRAPTPMMGSTTDFKVGLTIEFEGQAWKVVEFLHVKPGKGPAFVRSKLKNLENGNTLDKTWKAGETFPDAQVDKRSMLYSYIDGEDHVFMDMESFEEERIPTADILKKDYLKADTTIDVLFYKDKAIDVQVPNTVVLEVTEAAPGAKGNTAGGRTEQPQHFQIIELDHTH